MTAAHLSFGHGTDNAADEAAWIVTHVLNIPFADLAQRYQDRVDAVDAAKVTALVDARIRTRKPTAYLINEAWFAGLQFYVDERVIVPRSHLGEFIIGKFVPWLQVEVTRALDLCTGSGCIAIALAHAFPEAQIDAGDISRDALTVAQRNIAAHHMEARVHAIESDLFSALSGTYDLIVTNPPYVDAPTMAQLDPEFRQEPRQALASGDDGLTHILRILSAAPDYMTEGARLFAEVGNSCDALQARFPEVPFTWLTTASGDESVFTLSATELRQHHARFTRASSQRG